MDFSQNELIYRAEGNANLVIYLPQLKKVLRLPKQIVSPPPTNSLKSNENILNSGDHVAYITFMEHLLGKEYITRPEIIFISSDERDKLNRFCATLRPVERLDKEFCGQFGLLFPDATHLHDDIDSANNIENKLISGDTFAIEIKPKQGWMLQTIQSSCGDLFDLKGSSRCRYCSMQFSKLKHHKVKKLSTYCPMDLFSGNFKKMERALDSLFQYPQNNLRVFKNGILYYDDVNDLSIYEFRQQFFNGQFELLKELLIKCLLKNYTKINDDTILINNLPKGCVLEKVLSLQLLSKNNLQFMSNEIYGTEKTYKYLKSLINKSDIDSIDKLTESEQYMIGATALDFSIIITFKEIDNNFISEDNLNYVNVENRYFLTKITILDVDPKPDNHFNKFIMKSNQAYLDLIA